MQHCIRLTTGVTFCRRDLTSCTKWFGAVAQPAKQKLETFSPFPASFFGPFEPFVNAYCIFVLAWNIWRTKQQPSKIHFAFFSTCPLIKFCLLYCVYVELWALSTNRNMDCGVTQVTMAKSFCEFGAQRDHGGQSQRIKMGHPVCAKMWINKESRPRVRQSRIQILGTINGMWICWPSIKVPK